MIETTITTSRFIHVGDVPKSKPKATPTRETCDKVSASRVCLLKIRKSPNTGAIKEIRKDAWKACLMNP